MILEGGVKPNPALETLLKAEEGAKDLPDDDVVYECPRAKKKIEEQKPKPPVKALLWHLREFGGGFQSPTQRPDYCIQAYAKLIRACKADLVILAGLTRTIGWIPVGSGKAVRMRKEVVDAGLAEARRLITALGGGWQLVPVNGPDGKPAYHEHETACFLYNSSRGISCGKTEIAPCGPAFLGIAPMKIPGTFDAPPDLPLLAPLSAGRQTFPVEPGDDPPAQGSLPATGLVAFSTTQGLSGTDYLDFRSECDVQYTRSLEEGTVLKVPYWEEVAASEECIIENHIAVNPADVLLQDKAMYFEALKPDEHPKELDKVYGRLADSLLIRNNGGIAPRLEKVRILDLVRASLDADGIGRAGTGPALDEDSAIVAQRKAFADALPQPPEATPKTTVERQIAEAVLFARKLSDHWPIVADVYQA